MGWKRVALLGYVGFVMGCSSGTVAPSKSTSFTQVYTGRMEPAGFMSFPLMTDGHGTLTVSLTAEGNDLFFLIARGGDPSCVRNDCVPLARMGGDKKLQYAVGTTRDMKLVIWHVAEQGVSRDFSLLASFE